MPGFSVNCSASSMCRTCLQLGFKQNLPQAQIPVKKNDGKVIIILTKFFHSGFSYGLVVTDR